MSYTIRDFRVNSLPGVPIPNSRYYVPNGNGTDLNEYLTDLTGAYRLVGSAGSPSTDEKVKVSLDDQSTCSRSQIFCPYHSFSFASNPSFTSEN